MKLEFNAQQLQILNAALVELPVRVSAPLIQEINRQLKERNDLEIDGRNDLDTAPKQP